MYAIDSIAIYSVDDDDDGLFYTTLNNEAIHVAVV
jgi:hypothetical protein